LLRLTQLSARSLISGKWLSLCAQGWLVAVTLLPYIVLRYFVGGFDLAGEVEMLVLTLALSAVLVGICLALACLNSAVVRVISSILTIIFLFSLISSAPYRRTGFSLFAPSDAAIIAALLAVVGLPLLWLCLEFGAARLAPVAENHDTAQRWMVFLLFGLSFLGHGYWSTSHSPGVGGPQFLMLFDIYAACLVIWVLIQAAAEEPSPFPDTFRPFVRRGRVGRMFGRLALYQGWPSAVPFTILVAGMFFVEGTIYNLADWGKLLTFCAMLPPAVLFPQVAGWSLRSTNLTPRSRYFLVMIGCLVYTVALFIIGSVNRDSPALTLPICLAPPPAWLLLWTDYFAPGYATTGGHDYRAMAWTITMISSVPTLLAAILGASHYWPMFANLERRAQGVSQPLPTVPVIPSASAAEIPEAAQTEAPPTA
jgi:hypothetical protein